MIGSIAFNPLIPWVLLWALTVAAFLFHAAYVGRGGRAPVTRGLATLAVLFALAGPTQRQEERRSLPDVAVIVTDTSESTTAANRLPEIRRVVEALAETMRADPTLEVRTVEAGANADETRLLEAVDRALAGVPPERVGGAVLITDGRVADAASARGRPYPVHAVLPGERNERDRRLVLVSAPREGLVGSPTPLVIRVDDEPATGQSALVQISVDGGAPVSVEAIIGQPLTIPIVPRRRGPIPIALSVAEAQGELTTVNNVAAASVTGVRDRLRVLLVTGEPHAGERAWRNLLRSDPGVDLVHFTILRPPEKFDSTPVEELALIAFPVRELFEEKLDGFDLIVFDRFRRLAVLPDAYLENVASWVRGGGALMVAMGPRDAEAAEARPTPTPRGGPVDLFNPFSGSTEFFDPFAPRTDGDGLWATPLADVLPARPTGRVIEEAFRPGLTATGRAHPASAGLAPEADSWGRWFRLIEATPNGPPGQNPVLLDADGRPLLVLGREEQGRVALIASDQVWLWARGYDGGGPFAGLFNRVAHWLMAEPDLEDERLVLSPRSGDLVVERRSARFAGSDAEPGPVTLTDPDGNSRTLTLAPAGTGAYATTVARPQPGLWRATGDDLQAAIALGPAFPAETADVRATDTLIRRHGISALWVSEGANAPSIRRTAGIDATSGRDWIGLRRTNSATVTATRETPILPAWVWMLAALALTLGAWWREGRV